jgi:anti-sigma regulatory factor (Ser/Thr protein kinase)
MKMRSPISHTLGEQVSQGDGLLVLRLRARPSELKHARERVAEAGDQFGLASKPCYEFVFAVNEAVTNAIKHGRADEEGRISLRLDADGDELICTVSDCGPFVAPAELADPEYAESGRGFAFMSALVDELELLVEPEATVVRLRKRRATEAVGADA